MWLQIVVVAALAVAFASPSQPSLVPADEVHEGKVVAVTSDSITVMDNKDDDLDKFAVTPATTITRNGKPAKLSDVQVGDKAKVTATQEGTKLIAKSIAALAQNDEPRAMVRAHLNEVEIVELVWVNAVENYFNLTAGVLGIGSDRRAEKQSV